MDGIRNLLILQSIVSDYVCLSRCRLIGTTVCSKCNGNLVPLFETRKSRKAKDTILDGKHASGTLDCDYKVTLRPMLLLRLFLDSPRVLLYSSRDDEDEPESPTPSPVKRKEGRGFTSADIHDLAESLGLVDLNRDKTLS